eukprot:Skav221306  [mRNA]  locus=scaffold463:11673:17753:+ [translate_table: standard]
MLDCLGSEISVYVASILTFGRAFAFLCAVDAHQNLIVAGTSLGADLQVFATCLALAGVPVMIMANFGLHWGFGHYVQRFAHYLVACLAFDCFILCLLPLGSDMCSALANPYVLKKLCILCIEAPGEGAARHGKVSRTMEVLMEVLRSPPSEAEDEDKWDRERAFNIADSLENFAIAEVASVIDEAKRRTGRHASGTEVAQKWHRSGTEVALKWHSVHKV